MHHQNPVLKAARRRQNELVSFLQDLIRIRSLSGEEGAVVERIVKEMVTCQFDEVRIDPLGNAIGRIGSGACVIAMDAHIDTVGVDDESGWELPPFGGEIKDGHVVGRGAVDQKAGMAALVHAGALIKELGLEGDFTLQVTGTVQEEDCDGLCWQYLVREERLRPDCVVLTEPTDLRLNLGHRGRAEIAVRTRGHAAHASAPERGENAVYKAASIVAEIERLNRVLPEDAVLGKGSVAVTQVVSETPSLCSVPDACVIHLDRRLTRGETRESILAEVQEAVRRCGEQADVAIPDYDRPSHRGVRYVCPRFFPAWLLERDTVPVNAGRAVYLEVFGQEPELGTWTFSTNGVATQGLLGIPTIGLGPGDERFAHAVNERVPINQVVAAAAWYASFPRTFARMITGHEDPTAA